MFRPLLSIVIAFFASEGLIGQDDPTATKLKTAKIEFQKVAEKARDNLVEELRKKANSVQGAGDLKTLEKIEAEMKAFIEKGTLPKTIPTKIFEDELRKASAKMEEAFASAVKLYTIDDRRDLAKAVQKELDDHRKRYGAAVDLKQIESQLVGIWQWGDNRLRFDPKGKGTEIDGRGKFVSRFTWSLATDGSVRVNHDNKYTSVCRLNDEGKKMDVEVTSPEGTIRKQIGTRIEKK